MIFLAWGEPLRRGEAYAHTPVLVLSEVVRVCYKVRIKNRWSMLAVRGTDVQRHNAHGVSAQARSTHTRNLLHF